MRARLTQRNTWEVQMFRQISAVVFALALLALPAYAQQNAVPERATPAPATGADRVSPKAATADPNYVIGPQDILDINVWKEPEVSRAVPVRPDGKISLPLLNDVQAAGLTPAQLTQQISTG